MLADAHAEALRTETHPDVRDALAGWPSVRAVLTARTPAPAIPDGAADEVAAAMLAL